MTRIITKNGTGVPSNSSLATGELAVDTTNGKLYTSSDGTNIVNVGSSTGIDDNAASTAITISSSQKVGIGTDDPQQLLEVSASLNPVIRLDSSLVGNENDFDNTFMGGVEWYTNDTTGIGEHIGASLRAFSNASVATTTPGYELIFSTSLADVAESEAMRIDGNGNVGIGVDAPTDAALIVKGASNTGAPSTSVDATITAMGGLTGAGEGGEVRFAAFENQAGFASIKGEIADAANNTNGNLAFYSRNASSDTAMTKRYQINANGAHAWFASDGVTRPMTIDTTGKVGIGTTIPATILQTNVASGNNEFRQTVAEVTVGQLISSTTDQYLVNLGSGAQQFYTGGSERMRIDASGKVSIGTSSADRRLHVVSDQQSVMKLQSTGASSSIEFQDSTGSALRSYIGATGGAITFQTGNGGVLERVRIDTSGEVRIASTTDRGNYKLQVNTTGVWGQGSYVNGSDARWKDNVQTLECNCLDIVNNLRSVSYTYNEDSGASDLTTSHLGFIAQEVEQATGDHPWLSGLVTEDPEGYKSMAYQELIPVLTKAIQEQQGMIEELKTEVAALKGA